MKSFKSIATLVLLGIVLDNVCSKPFSMRAKKREMILKSWSDAAYEWMTRINCTDDYGILCGQECEKARKLSRKDIRVYATNLVHGQKYRAIFVEGDSYRQKAYHEAVIVLDPFPQTRFGHPILAFYVDTEANRTYCNSMKGFLIGDNSTCMQPIYRTRTTYGQDYNFRSRSFGPKSLNCQEMLFLPLVFTEFGQKSQVYDELECKSNIIDFHPRCPILRPKADTRSIDCKPELTNKECGFLENSLRGRCSDSKTCDQAVLLSGGWNRQLSDVDSFNNIFNMKNLLITHGYNEANIELFFANGVPKYDIDGKENDISPYHRRRKEANTTSNESNNEDDSNDEYDALTSNTPAPPPVPYHSASIKSSMRNHIQSVCESSTCADTFFIYMNNPVTMDGTSLLWDYYDDGMANDTEIYTPKELMRDISRCKANRVIIMADQSYGVELVAAAASRSASLVNVIIFTSSQEFSLNSKDKLTNYLLKYQADDICLRDLKIRFSDDHGLPVFVGQKNEYLLNSTLVGAPCQDIMKLKDLSTAMYRGCQLSDEL